MHRTDSIDLVVVISGEGNMSYPDENGELKEIHLKVGDFLVQNGNFHAWHNRSGAPFVVLFVTLGAERKGPSKRHMKNKVPVIVVDGVVKLPSEANGAVVVGGSNATAYAAYFSAKAGVRAAIHHDCGIGRDEAGVRGLPWADQHGMAMAAVATDSARAGDAADMLHRGIISRVNKLAATCGVETGQTVAQAVELLKSAPWPTQTWRHR